MARNIKKHGYTAVSPQSVLDLFAEQGDTPGAPQEHQPKLLSQLCTETLDAKCTLPQELALLTVSNPHKKHNLMTRYHKTLKDFQDIRANLQDLPAESMPRLKDLFSQLTHLLSKHCPKLSPYITLDQGALDTLYKKHKRSFTQHMKAPCANKKWAFAFIAERYFLKFLTQSIDLPNTKADTIYVALLA